MFEFLVLGIIVWLIVSLSSKVSTLQREIFFLKRNVSKNGLSVRGMVSLKTLPQKAPAIVESRVEKENSLYNSLNKQTTQRKSLSNQNIQENRWFKYIKEYFTQGNIVVRIGGVILFFGLAFLAKYAADKDMISIEIRMLTLVVFSFVLIGVGWRLREREGHYGLILQGLGIGVFYLVVFVSAKMYMLLPLSTAFIIMVVIVIFGSLLAIAQNAIQLAIFALGGGFLAPILSSDGSGSHIVLFSYYTLLNSAIVGIAWYRSWRVLNLMGFVFTFVIATAWGVLQYKSEFFISTEPFLILFFLFYLGVSILFSYKQTFELKGIVDSSLVFGLPFVAFSLQVSLAHEFEYALAISAIVMGSLYLVLYKLLSKQKNMKLLSESFLSLGIIFYTIAVPYLFDEQITGALWVVEASAMLWVALNQKRNYARIFAQILLVVSTLVYIVATFEGTPSSLAFLNSIYLGYIVVFVGNFFSSYMLYKFSDELSSYEKESSVLFLGIAFFLWFFSAFNELTTIYTIPMGNTMLIYVALSALVLSQVALRFKWKTLTTWLQAYLVLGGLLFMSLLSYYEISHPFGDFGAISIVLFFGVHYFLLYLFDDIWTTQSSLHLVALWILTLLAVVEVSYLVLLISENSTYLIVSEGIVLTAILALLLQKERFIPKFFASYVEDYRYVGAFGVIVILSIWELSTVFISGAPEPLPYLPFLNPLELVELSGLYFIYVYFKKQENIRIYLGAIFLLFLTIVLARSVHFYAGVEYSPIELFDSMTFQMFLSILWTIIAMSSMIKANTWKNRRLWIAGASLIGVVVVKLFFIELANSGGVERIVSFIAVGLLLLLVGYFSPLPTQKKEIS